MYRYINASLIIFLTVIGLFFSSKAEAATQIYRSVGAGNTAVLASGTSNTLNISGSTATFNSALPNPIGVGDVLEYDSDNNGSNDALAFISYRASSSEFTVKRASGTAPISTSAGDNDWKIFRAYTSLENAEKGVENTGIALGLRNFDDWTAGGDAASSDVGYDLVSNDLQWNIACYGDADDNTAGVAVSDWTTDTTRFLKIYTPFLPSEVGTSQRHQGVWTDSAYQLVIPDGTWPDSSPIVVNNGGGDSVNVWIDGLQIFTGSSDPNYNGIEFFNITGETKISNNIIKTDPAYVSNSGIGISNTDHVGTYKIWNNLIYGFFDGGISFNAPLNTVYAYNNTVYGQANSDVCYRSIAGIFSVKNNIVQNCATGYLGASTTLSEYNLSDLVDAPGDNNQNNATVSFVSTSTQNFHLAAADTEAIGAGTNLSADSSLSFTVDFENQTRGAVWDIGADEYATSSDETAPFVISFIIPATSASLTVPITTFTATDNVAVTGYKLTEASSTPAAGDAGWTAGTSSTYVFASAGIKTLYAWAKDAVGNVSTSSNDSVTITLPDSTAPILSGSSPSGSLANSTTQTTLSVTTDENATCKYSTTAGVAYASMTSTFSTTGSTAHSQSVSGLTAGTSYNYYVRCSDGLSNANSSDYSISFSVAASGGGGGGGGGSTPVVVKTTLSRPTNFTASSTAELRLGLAWKNPLDTNFSEVWLLRRLDRAAASTMDGIRIYRGGGQAFVDSSLENNKLYYYSLYAYDGQSLFSEANTISYRTGSATATPIFPIAPITPTPIVAGVEPAAIIDEADMIFGFNKNVPLDKTTTGLYSKALKDSKKPLSAQARYALAYFIHYGSATTKVLGAGERTSVILSYQISFGALPQSLSDWQDVIKISQGRWPVRRNQVAESQAKKDFKKIYKREANLKLKSDETAITVMAYGLRPSKRNLASESFSLRAFKNIYKRGPLVTADWNIVRAIAYSGAKR